MLLLTQLTSSVYIRDWEVKAQDREEWRLRMKRAKTWFEV
jgi:hypothetical protein